jgi:hypothetical protein
MLLAGVACAGQTRSDRISCCGGIDLRRLMGGRRSCVAALAVLGLLFAQFVAAAHACTVAFSPPAPVAIVASAVDDAMPSDCAGNAKRTNANVCESHCTHGQQIDADADAPVAAIAPQPALTVRVPSRIAPRSFDTIALHARSTAPPLSILFGRFLI